MKRLWVCVAYVAYTRWFISVWCYFAAALSVLVLTHFKPVPTPAVAFRAVF